MAAPRRLSATGSLFLDRRGDARALRVSWHHDDGLVVLSLWRDDLCTGSFRLHADEVPGLITLLREGLDAQYDAARDRLDRADRAG